MTTTHRTPVRVNPYPDVTSLDPADFPRNEYGDVIYDWLVNYATREQFIAWQQANNLKPVTWHITVRTSETVAESKAS